MNIRIRLAPLGLAALAACSTPPAPVGTAYEAGKDHLANGRSGKAIEAFRAALQEENRSLRVLNALGASYDAIGRPELAEPYYREALIVAPDDVQTLNNLGYSLLLAGRADEAAALLAKALAVAPEDSVIAANLTMARERMGRPRRDDAPRRSREAAVTMPAGPWIERTTRIVQTLRTDPSGMKQAIDAGADPRLAIPAAPPEDLRPAPRAAVEMETLMPLPKALEAPIVPPPPPRPRADATTPARLAGTCAIEVSNGNGRDGAAQRMRAWLRLGSGHPIRLTNAATFAHPATVLHFSPACAAEARALARTLPVAVDLRADQEARGLRLVLGRDLLPFDKTIGRDA
ncbi:MAG: LytR C-terminal domain-containing protein [Solirubrobacterales bacterium]